MLLASMLLASMLLASWVLASWVLASWVLASWVLACDRNLQPMEAAGTDSCAWVLLLVASAAKTGHL
jgi:hypothetical protein